MFESGEHDHSCDHCGKCSWPEQVARSRATLPNPWREELLMVEQEKQSPVPDAVWVAAMLKCEAGGIHADSALDGIVSEAADAADSANAVQERPCVH